MTGPMARGTARAPSQNAYRGALGRTQQTLVHVTGPGGELVAAQVYTTIDAVENPELVDRLYAEDPAQALNVVRFESGDPVRVAMPVLYHDPAAELLVLVLDPSQRHRELDERIRVFERLKEEEVAIPTYVKEFGVVFGPAGLRADLEQRAKDALEQARMVETSRDGERRKADITAREGDLERNRIELDRKQREFERRSIELEVSKADLAGRLAIAERERLELARDRSELERLRSEARNRVIAAAQQGETTAVGDVPREIRSEEPSAATKPMTKAEIEGVSPSADDIETALQSALSRPDSQGEFEHASTGVSDASEIRAETDDDPSRDFEDEGTTGASIVPQGSDPLTTETMDLEIDRGADAWLDRTAAAGTSAFTVSGGNVRLALVAGEQIARGLAGVVDVRVLLHRVTTYPVIAVVLGPPAALRVPSPTQLAIVTLDIASDSDRHVLQALAKRFEIELNLIVRGKRVRRAKLAAPLSENVGFVIRAAEDHLRGVSASAEFEAGEAYRRAVDLVCGAGYDLLGVNHPDTSEFRDDKLAQLQTAQQLRRAIAMARRFARPSREDYLVCTRGFPLPRWRELRQHVLESAVAWGLWMGPELAQVAVSEGLARSRRDLIGKLDRGFEALRQHPTAFDIDEDAAEDNAKALAEEARSLGVELAPSRAATRNGAGAIVSDEASVVSGSIGGTPAHGSARPTAMEDLIAQLDHKERRLTAALELCDSADPAAAGPVIRAATKMSRAEAVRVLGMAVKFGEAAQAPLLEGLGSSKGFLRHGCALALALLRTEDGTQAVIDLLLTEPTEIWREVARAIGQVGPTALLPLASTYGRLGDRATPALSERVAWAMAHVAVRGGKAAVETMANGQSVVVPVARQALEFHASAANDQVRVHPQGGSNGAGRDVTVNRAFSRRFFEALEQGLPDAAQAGLVDLDASQPMEMLDESDLIEDEDESELDESDLIQP